MISHVIIKNIKWAHWFKRMLPKVMSLTGLLWFPYILFAIIAASLSLS